MHKIFSLETESDRWL